jgi:vanillate O-demethylase monooxygenase subunit
LVWVWMGERALVDEDLIPHVPWPPSKRGPPHQGYTHVTADYRLRSDNLLDLSHENYIHQATIGNEAEETIAAHPVQVSVPEGRVARAHREMANIAPPPMFAMMMQSDARIDRWQTALWTAPGINLTDVGAHPIGTSPADAFRARVLHLLTPETATSTHYFWAHCRSFRLADQELTASIIAAHRRTFDEDKEMLELQQRELDAMGATVPKIALKVDDAPLPARRGLNKLVRQEEEGASVVLAKVQHLVTDGEVLENARSGLNLQRAAIRSANPSGDSSDAPRHGSGPPCLDVGYRLRRFSEYGS